MDWTPLIQPGDTVIDVGANVGRYTTAFAAAVGPTGQVLAFEPHPEAADDCRIACQGSPWVEVRTQAVWDTPGPGTLYRDGPTTSCSLWRTTLRDATSATDTPVEMVRLDDVVPGPIQGLKIDAQGGDGWVLVSAARLLAAMPARGWVLVELWPMGLRQAQFSLERFPEIFAGWTLTMEGKAPQATRRTLAEQVAMAQDWDGGRHTNLLMRKGLD